MLTRRIAATAAMAFALVAVSGAANAAERSLMGIVLGRSYRQVLDKFGTPTRVQAVLIPIPGQGTTGTPDMSNPGGPPGYGAPAGYGAPGGGPPGYAPPGGGSGGSPSGAGSGGAPLPLPGGGGPGMGGGPSYGAPGGGPPGYGGGGGSGGGPPALPPVGGAPGMPGYGGDTGTGPGGAQLAPLGNGAEWIYNRPGGTTMAFVINEDGRVAQISVSSERAYPAARTSKGIGIGADMKRVLTVYGWPQSQLVGGYFVETYYTKNHHAAFTFVKGKLVRITIALAD